ncbi:uncharacterized protein [Paramisgurnus dabryanus]|uniref:uncharacterized protein n=1 Tax=Paramisgurnus dabryanus TaxID=90735 RepID=UPI003CCF2174
MISHIRCSADVEKEVEKMHRLNRFRRKKQRKDKDCQTPLLNTIMHTETTDEEEAAAPEKTPEPRVHWRQRDTDVNIVYARPRSCRNQPKKADHIQNTDPPNAPDTHCEVAFAPETVGDEAPPPGTPRDLLLASSNWRTRQSLFREVEGRESPSGEHGCGTRKCGSTHLPKECAVGDLNRSGYWPATLQFTTIYAIDILFSFQEMKMAAPGLSCQAFFKNAGSANCLLWSYWQDLSRQFSEKFFEWEAVRFKVDNICKEEPFICPACTPEMLAVSVDGNRKHYHFKNTARSEEPAIFEGVFIAKDKDVTRFVDYIHNTTTTKSLPENRM